MKVHAFTFLAASLMALHNSNTWAQGYIVDMPPAAAGEGNSSTPQPFSVRDSRFQQLYGMQSILLEPFLIRSITFRLDGTNGSDILGQMANIQVRMSTIPGQPDSLSPTFANNIGANEIMTFSGAVEWHALHHTPSLIPEPFDLRIDLQQPFLYQPSMGNLLVDFTVGNTTIFSQFDAFNRASDSVSSVSGSAFSPSGTASTLGLATRFGGAIVPEPASYALALIGVVAFTLLRRKRK